MISRVILITGCSSGFGMLIAARLCKDYTVYATMRNVQKATDLLELAGEYKDRLVVLPLDVTKRDSIVRVIQTIEQSEGQLHMLINNAGFGLGGFFEDLSESEIRDQFETNFFGLQAVTREALPLIRESSGDRKVINISSIAGLTGTPCLSAYNASKWAVEGFSESLYYELKLFGINTVLLEPGRFKTKIFTDNMRLAKKMKESKSPYYRYSMKLLDYLDKSVDSLQSDPKKVADLVCKIITLDTPKFRYLVGIDAKVRLFLKRLLPFSWYAGLILRRLR